MNILLALLVGALLSGCARTKIVSWEGGQFTVCGNKWAHDEDFEGKAAERCPSGHKALSGGVRGTGDYSVGNGDVTQHKNYCVVYQCTR